MYHREQIEIQHVVPCAVVRLVTLSGCKPSRHANQKVDAFVAAEVLAEWCWFRRRLSGLFATLRERAHVRRRASEEPATRIPIGRSQSPAPHLREGRGPLHLPRPQFHLSPTRLDFGNPFAHLPTLIIG